MNRAAVPAVRPLTGRHVLIMIVAFFAVVIGVDVLFASFAYRSFSGEVASNPYEAGLAFNQTLAQRRREAALGWTAEVRTGDGLVELRLRDRTGQALRGLTVTGVLERPATEAGRQTLSFAESADGWLRARANLSGGWDLRATARGAQGEILEIERRLMAP